MYQLSFTNNITENKPLTEWGWGGGGVGDPSPSSDVIEWLSFNNHVTDNVKTLWMSDQYYKHKNLCEFCIVIIKWELFKNIV